MRLHLIAPRRLVPELAGGLLSGLDQARYLAVGFVVWLIPSYLFVVPPLLTRDPYWFYGLWIYEFACVLFIQVAGVFYCLRKCRVAPARTFLIDFSCLYAPVSLTTLVVVWMAYHLSARGIGEIMAGMSFDTPPPMLVHALYSTKFFDVIRYLAIIGINVIIFYRIGGHMAAIAELREGNNRSSQAGADLNSTRTQPAAHSHPPP